MENSFRLVILTPYGRYLDGQVTFLEVRNDKYSYGITKGHTPMVATVEISKMRIRFGNQEFIYAVGGGMINVESDKVTLVLNSIERSDEVDIDRAIASKKRAEDRLEQIKENPNLDIARIRSSLARALVRIEISQDKR
ncbi:MAG: ATP synthase F1 subunit epsilon [Bacilli bacterium]|nr:ATP synthase F1 subunit epsilon [Bacilli bacterium]